MTDVVIQMELFHFKLTGVKYMMYANRYREAAVALHLRPPANDGFDPIVYQLFCQSLELHLKSFIWLMDQNSVEKIEKKYRHNLQKLWSRAKMRGIHQYAVTTPLRDEVITFINPYYNNRQFSYLDLDMVNKGYHTLKIEPKIVHALNRLTKQLSKSLRNSILCAS